MPSTAQLLLLADRARPRTQQVEIGPSDLGSCRRRVGYKMAGTKPVNLVGSVTAMIGTAVHDAVASIMPTVAQPGDLVEHRVTYAGISGNLDRYEADRQTVVDTKTTSSRWLEHIRLHGPDHGHIWQLSWYAAGLMQQGRPVKRIRLEYLARDTGEEHPWSKPFDIEDVRDALMWLKVVRDSELDFLPREYEPESTQCKGCPFGGPDGGICWEGHIPGRDLRSVLYVEDPDAAKWADELAAGRAEAAAGKARADRAKGALSAVVDPNGVPTNVGGRWLRYDARGSLKFVSGPRDEELTA